MCGDLLGGVFLLSIMKYTITCNQYAVIRNGFDLDFNDLAIFDFIKDFANSNNCTKIQTPEGVFLWISHKLIMDQLPLLGIKTNQGIMKRIDKLVACEILRKHPNCTEYGKTLYAFGKNYDKMVDFVDTPQQMLRVPHNESLGRPHNESLGYNNNNSYNGDKEIKREPAQSAVSRTPEIPQVNLFGQPDTVITENKKEKESCAKEKEKKTLMANSEFFNRMAIYDTDGKIDANETANNLEREYGDDYGDFDLLYYFVAVRDWSYKKNAKRTAMGWRSTICEWIRDDMSKNKEHRKLKDQQAGGIDAELLRAMQM